MYHYTECGLDNVWLANGFQKKRTPYGEAVSIEGVDELHSVLALRLADKKGRLTGKELRFLRCLLDLSQPALGRMIGVTDQSVSLWERTGKVPKAADAYVRMLVLGKLDGKATISTLLERVTVADRIVNEAIVAKENSRKKWTATAAAKPEHDALAA